MKKIVSVVTVLVALLMLAGCNAEPAGIPKYLDKECYYGKGIQDYTDYCKFFYNEETVKEFATLSDYKQVADSDIEEIKGYFEDFYGQAENQKYYDKVDFDYNTQVKQGDYFRIVTKEGYPEYGYYDIYYVDMTKCILYFVHSNI